MTQLHDLIKHYDIQVTPDLQKALDLAHSQHEGVTRSSGEPYIHHIFRILSTLQKLGVSESILIAAALHDVPEDTPVSNEEVIKMFGERVGFMVYALTKNQQYKKHLESKETDRSRIILMYANRMHVSIVAEPFVLFVKVADQIDNISTLQALKPAKQLRKIQEVQDIFLPMYEKCQPYMRDRYVTIYRQLLDMLRDTLTAEKTRYEHDYLQMQSN